MRPVPGVVSAVVAVEHIVTRVLQISGGALALFHIPADFNVVLVVGNRAFTETFGLGYDRIAERYGVILAALGFYRLHYFHGETIAVFKTAAVFVRPLVGVFHRELIEEVALVYGVNFNAVYARVFAKFCGFSKRVHHFFYLFDRKRTGIAGVVPTVGGRARACRQIVHV